MKNFGCKAVYHSERTRDLLRAYFSYLHSCRHVSMPQVFKTVVEMPSARFWISKPRATVVVSRILQGDTLKYMRPTKREMFFEIHRRVTILRHTHPHWSLPRLVDAVISQPAPKFYLTPASARALILKARSKWFAERMRTKMCHYNS